jgi:NET1-associated nuclear protein 1 (U3 small nucleolar RNA-associated protein 17)
MVCPTIYLPVTLAHDLLAVYMFKTPLPIRCLLSWGECEKFAIAQESSSPSVSKTFPVTPTTIFSIFGLQSDQPTKRRTVPFSLRQYTSWQNKRTESNSLVAITSEGELVHIGDEVIQAEDEGSGPRPLGSTHSEPSLFQDIFGKSALVDYTSPDQIARAKPASQQLALAFPAGKGVDWEILETPAHLLPPVHTLFMPLMESMLLNSGRAYSTADEQREEEQDQADAMIVDVSDQKVGSTSGRDISNTEIDAFVDFFRKTAFTGTFLFTIYPMC